MISGEEKGWEILRDLEPDDVCKRAQVFFDKTRGCYLIKSFNREVSVSPEDKTISSHAPGSDILLQRLGYFSKLSILWYLVNAKDIPLSGEPVKPVGLTGGQIFFRGTHILPLDKLAVKYGDDLKGFITKGRNLGSEPMRYGDVSLRLFPLPRIPVILILWRADDEFPPRADLLLDSTCEFHLPIDIIWSVAMMSVLIML